MKNPHISDELYFGLNLSTLAMSQFNNYDPDTILGFTEPTDEFVEYIKSTLHLRKITNLKEAKDRLYFYANDQMYNRMFKEMSFQIDLMSASEFEEHVEGLESAVEYKRFQLVKMHYFDLGARGIQAYDVSEYVKLSRLCGICGFLSENEVKNRIWDMSMMTKKWFKSWNDYHKVVMIGEQFAEAYAQQDNNVLNPTVVSQQLWRKLSNEAKFDNTPFYSQPLFSKLPIHTQ
ncbi:DUF1266 domain-containing protein [Bizionia sp.]|uniref:DUF1266 domain-containing protein n=1 Tax=Bizionia sp. TaxID=1954480 RepID=UPI003A956865